MAQGRFRPTEADNIYIYISICISSSISVSISHSHLSLHTVSERARVAFLCMISSLTGIDMASCPLPSHSPSSSALLYSCSRCWCFLFFFESGQTKVNCLTLNYENDRRHDMRKREMGNWGNMSSLWLVNIVCPVNCKICQA